ncbi:MAG: alpha/beta hydrolase domain-containing protein [Acidobacteriota bacterium]|nr:alpha/beta hydrolase domain-containing protein [Acidobacteriota bacterium]
MISACRVLLVVVLSAALFVPTASADVSSFQITGRQPVEDGRSFGEVGSYEELVGTITFAIDPALPVNQVIANLDRVPRNADGKVEATGDVRILVPSDPTRGNGVALVDIANRGRLTALGFNRGGSGPLGDGFLLKHGFTVVWVGWEFDVPEDRPIRLTVPSVDGLPVGGLGFAAIRDTTSWIKYDATAAVTAEHTLSFGSSQSGRFLRTFLYLGFNTDTAGRQVFDGVIPHIAGASRLDLNQPGAAPISLGMFDATSFPFADAAMIDPVTGVLDGTLGNDRSRDNQPLVFYTNSGVEYWGGGRVATLVHSTPDGTEDVELQDNVRFYFLAGTQHGPGRFPPPPPGNRQEMGNPTDYWWNMRALLTAMTRWVVDGIEPPPSQHPRFADSNLVAPADIRFPAIPDVRSPRDRTAGERVANPWLGDGHGGAKAPLPMLVPQVDNDGNEISGIRHPEVAVPLATYTGWNFTNPDQGDPNVLVSLAGSYIPFAATREQREARQDPRRSIEERYDSRDDFLTQVEAAGRELIAERYLLEDDLASIMERAAEHWNLLVEN